MAFTGGGTAGHINPGLAVAEALTSLMDCRIVWIGNRDGMDRSLVERSGIEFIGIPAGKFRREFSLRNASDLFRIAAGWSAARKVLKDLRPSLLFSKGGYVSVPPCAAAASLGIPVYTHESDATPGLATKLNARHAELIFTAYADTVRSFKPSLAPRVRHTGNPLRPALERGDSARGRAWLGFDGTKPLLLFIGGSQGARQINGIVADCLPSLSGLCDIVHQTGTADPLPPAAPGYRPLPYIHDELPDVLAASDLVVSRSGAGLIWECGSLGKPMVLVPLASGATRGDQVLNARIFASAGAAVHCEGEALAPSAMTALIKDLLSDRARLAAMGDAGRKLCPSDAASRIASVMARRIQGGGP